MNTAKNYLKVNTAQQNNYLKMEPMTNENGSRKQSKANSSAMPKVSVEAQKMYVNTLIDNDMEPKIMVKPSSAQKKQKLSTYEHFKNIGSTTQTNRFN
jgi:hypothetical protein